MNIALLNFALLRQPIGKTRYLICSYDSGGCAVTDDNRRVLRHRCKIRARITAGDRSFEGHIIDVSTTGVRLLTDQIIDIWKGTDIEIHTYELGVTKAKVRWRSPGRLGARVDDSVDMKSKLEAYRKFYNVAALR